YGLRKLEQDRKVSAEEKLKEWRAYIDRAKQQLAYANKAVARWKKTARREMLDSAREADRDPRLRPRDKIDRWTTIVELYPRTSEARSAQRRVTHWSKEETKRLIRRAQRVDGSDSTKLERIEAWEDVQVWAKRGPEARAADRRIRDLQRELFAEARSVDRIARFDVRRKLAAWRDVLKGRPTQTQKATAQRRLRALEAKLSN
ncbi:MAG: hypothetical protein AAFN74_15130, partial [Myxococcota bacterium]